MKYLLNLFAFVFVFGLTSCSDPCSDVECGAHGTCDDGTCLCDEGYEGTLCDAKLIDKFVSSWKSTSFQCDGEQEEITFVVEQGSSITTMSLYEIEDPEFVITNITQSENVFTIPAQVLDGTQVSGTGTINEDGSMSFNIDVAEDGFEWTCSGTFVKQ